MANQTVSVIKRLAQIALALVLIIVALATINTFLTMSRIEDQLAGETINYSDILNDTPKTEQLKNNTKDPKELLIYGDGSNYSIGPDNARLIIVEFADFGCPYCKKSFSKIREITVNHNQDIKYIFRDLPIVKNHSLKLALAGRCAGEQGFFWPMHDRLFIEQGISTDKEIRSLAQTVGVDITKFDTCYQSQKYLPQIKKDLSDASALGIDKVGTPVWFINGYQIAGDIPQETFNKIINDYLNNN